MTFPGTAIEVSELKKGSTVALFDGIFATGGITLSQVSIMTGLEPYLIQNWVKRGFVASPVKRLYSREQLARIAIINMLREALQIERICGALHMIGKNISKELGRCVGDDEIYHVYVDMLAECEINIADGGSVETAARYAAESFGVRTDGTEKQLSRMLQIMLYANSAAVMRTAAEEIISTLY